MNVTPKDASLLAEQVRQLFSAHTFEVENGKVSLSIGIASLHSAYDLPLESLVSHADQALYLRCWGAIVWKSNPCADPEPGLQHPAAPAQCMEFQQTAG